MKRILFFILVVVTSVRGYSQTFYVNAISGNDAANGSEANPLLTLQKAVVLAKQSASDKPVTIKIAPGLYVLNTQLKIESGKGRNDTSKYALEAIVMPDEAAWTPNHMPVIASISPDNTYKNFSHCAGVEVDRENVCIRGLKFVGNPNPAANYYYPIEKDTTLLKNLEISQCYFTGDKNGAPVQGAIYAEGQAIHVDHCIFYDCKNAVLAFEKVSDLSITHCIIYGAYEAAVWYGYQEPDKPFIFSDNIVSHCNYFWASSKGLDHSVYAFNNSLICENEHYIGMQNGKGGVVDLAASESYKETRIRKSGKVLLTEVKTEGLPHNYLNLAPGSDGQDIQAGIFKIAVH